MIVFNFLAYGGDLWSFLLQAKNGMLVDFKRPAQTPTERLSQLAKAGEASKVSVPNPGRAAAERGKFFWWWLMVDLWLVKK